jgi:hypothetical protein
VSSSVSSSAWSPTPAPAPAPTAPPTTTGGRPGLVVAFRGLTGHRASGRSDQAADDGARRASDGAADRGAAQGAGSGAECLGSGFFVLGSGAFVAPEVVRAHVLIVRVDGPVVVSVLGTHQGFLPAFGSNGPVPWTGGYGLRGTLRQRVIGGAQSCAAPSISDVSP